MWLDLSIQMHLLAASRLAKVVLADGKSVHQAALRPKAVWTAGQLHHRLRAEVTLEYLAIIANGFNHASRPSVVEQEILAVAVLHAE